MEINAIPFAKNAFKKRLLTVLTFGSTMLIGQTALAKCEFTVTSSWNGGYQAILKISGELQPIQNWKAVWQFASGTSVSFPTWGGPTVTGTNPYTATAWTSSTTLNSTDVFNLSMNVNGTDKNPKLSGNACEAWTNKDIGTVGAAGSATIAGNKITLKGAGNDIGNDVDAFNFYYTSLQGDGEVSAYIEPGVVGPSDWTKVGVMIRGDLDANAENYAFVLRPQFGSQSQFRPSKNAGYSDASERLWVQNPDTTDTFFETKHHINYVDKYPSPYRAHYLQPGKWLKAVRTGNSVLTYSSDDGKCWNLRSRNDNAHLGQQVYAGFVLSSHVAGQLATASISSLSKNQTLQSDVNWECGRAKVDGEIAPPTDWIVKPAVFNGDYWSITYKNPNSVQRPATCRSRSGWTERRFKNDSTYCPAEITQESWTRPGFNLGPDWLPSMAGGFGNIGKGNAAYAGTTFNKKEFWLRKEFQISCTKSSNMDVSCPDYNKIVLWGRWANSASIYINGVLATNIYNSWMSDAYHYLGLRDEARDALINGTNVISAHIECTNCDNAFTDFGVGRNPKLGKFYLRNQITDSTSPNYNPNYNPNTKTAKLAKVFTDYVKETAVLGGSVAVYQQYAVGDPQYDPNYPLKARLVESTAIGYRDRTLNENMPKQPILRLASVDKSPTRAAIRKLLTMYTTFNGRPFNANSKAFGPNGVLSDIAPVGGQWGSNVQDITIAQLHDHISGLNDNGEDEQGSHDEIAFKFGIPASQITMKHLIGYWISQPTRIIPGAAEPGSQYSSGGHAVLRYIVERVSGMSIADFLKTNLNATDFAIAYERMEERKLGPTDRETGYMLIGKETRSRWYELEEYRALSASAEGLTKFFYDNDLGVKDFSFKDSSKFLGPNGGGAMDGTHSGAVIENIDNKKTAYAYIWNSDKAPSNRFEILRTLALYSDLYPGTCNPTDAAIAPNQNFRIDSVASKGWYMHTGSNNIPQDPSYTPNLQFSLVGGTPNIWDFQGINWRFEKVNGQSYYVIRNELKNKVLGVTSAAPALKDQATTPDTLWTLTDMTDHFRLTNKNGETLYVDTANVLRAGAYDNSAADKFKWYICN